MLDREASRKLYTSRRTMPLTASGRTPMSEDCENPLDKDDLSAGLENFLRYLEVLREWDRQAQAEMTDELE